MTAGMQGPSSADLATRPLFVRQSGGIGVSKTTTPSEKLEKRCVSAHTLLILAAVLSFLIQPVGVVAADDDFGSVAILGAGGAYTALPGEAATIWFNPALSSLSLS